MYNPDGSEALTCVNGLRCIVRYGAEDLGISTLTIEIGKGQVTGSVVDPIARGVVTTSVTMGPISWETSDVPIIHAENPVIGSAIPELSNRLTFTALAAPNPQLVCSVDAIDEIELARMGKVCESAPDFLPSRANISMVQKLDSNSIFVSTFERGAGITGSCGSAMASSVCALCLLDELPVTEPIKVVNRNGYVQCLPELNDAGEFYLTMCGNATYEFSTTVDIDASNESLTLIADVQTRHAERDAYQNLHRDAQSVMAAHNIVLGPSAADAIAS